MGEICLKNLIIKVYFQLTGGTADHGAPPSICLLKSVLICYDSKKPTPFHPRTGQ
jgi:hypothetical protein